MKKFLTLLFLSLFGVLFVSYAHADTTTLLPSSDGTYLQWVPSSGTTHYTLVNESLCDGNTTYVSTNTVGNRDSYGLNLSSIPNGATITQIGITPCASKNGIGGSSTMNVFYRLNGTNSADTGSYALGNPGPVVLGTTSYTGLSTVKGSTTTFEAGSVYSSGTKGARLSQVSVAITYTPLAAPTNLTATAVAPTQINLSWVDNATTETGYSVERATSSTGPFSVVGTTGANVTSYQDTTVSENTRYFYRVAATNSGGESAYSNTASAQTPQSIPLAPSNLTATGSAGATNLSWADNSFNESGFQIERSLVSTGPWNIVGTTSANISTYTDTTTAVDEVYYYRVGAFNTAGYAYSNVASISTWVTPAAPTNLNATGSTGAASLSWIDNAFNEDGFVIERSTDSAHFVQIATVSTNVTTYLDQPLVTGTYYYRVRAYNIAGYSSYSNTASAVVQ